MSIEAENISYTYMAKTPYEREALKHVSVKIDKGEFVALIGHTGCGKSTLAEHLNGLLTPFKGTVSVDGVALSGKGSEVKAAKHKVGMVFQYPEYQLFAETIFEDIAFGPRNSGKSEPEIELLVKNALDFVDLSYEEFAQRSPFQLSGGQMRRVAIAGVIAMQPDYLIMDEPSAGLDPRSRDYIFAKLQALHKERRIGVILITHSMEEAAAYAERLLIMSKGEIIVDGAVADVFSSQREALLSAGVDVPHSLKLSELLRERGLAIKDAPLTKSALVKSIKQAKGWGSC